MHKNVINRTMFGSALLLKYLFGFVVLVPVILSVRGVRTYPARMGVLIPLLVWGVFCLTAAEVNAVDQRVLRYRRLLRWKEIPYSQIQQCKDSRIPGFAYLTLAHAVGPWGRLYFVTARPAFTGNPRELAEFINSHRITTGTHSSTRDGSEPKDRGTSLLRLTLICLVGVACSFAYSYLSTGFQPSLPEAGSSGWVATYRDILDRGTKWPWALAIIGLLVTDVLRSRDRSRHWLNALIIGVVMGSMILKALN
jgi:hypothetical protein